jgi:hypothetical protein
MGITVHILTQYISGALNCCFKTRVSLHFKLRTLYTVNDKFGNVCKYCDSVYYILSGINSKYPSYRKLVFRRLYPAESRYGSIHYPEGPNYIIRNK